MVIFAEKLKYERIAHGYSQEEFANMLGIPRGTYAHYEISEGKGSRQPPFETIRLIAKLLDVSIDYLFGLEE